MAAENRLLAFHQTSLGGDIASGSEGHPRGPLPRRSRARAAEPGLSAGRAPAAGQAGPGTAGPGTAGPGNSRPREQPVPGQLVRGQPVSGIAGPGRSMSGTAALG